MNIQKRKRLMKKTTAKISTIAMSLCLILSLQSLDAVCVYANPIDDKASQLVCWGAPVSSVTNNDQYLLRTTYAVHYLYRTKTAEYVCEHLTKNAISGPAKRKDDFRPDPELADSVRANLSDYNKTYDRGHLDPADDNTQSAKIMSECFLLSNMVPQNPNLNRGMWKKLETVVRNWVRKGKDLYVITGTVYGSTHRKIGRDSIGVPMAMWKVIVDRKSRKFIGFKIPNAAVSSSDLPKYAVPISDITKETGVTFFPALPPDLLTEKNSAPKLVDWPGL
ncbi:MAG: DNA/RNA non-specific endonuclease [Chlorobium sp.]|nr:MAG: DNA/RNA non-specific endonuclease [Chlorobium sp.]